MALLSFDGAEGFDGPTNANQVYYWMIGGDLVSANIPNSEGAEGTYSYDLNSADLEKGFNPGDNKFIIGFWYHVTQVHHNILAVGNNDFTLFGSVNGCVEAYRWNSNFLARSNPVLQPNSSIYIECEVVRSSTVGTVRMRFNGSATDDVSETGLDTTTGSDSWSFMRLIMGGGGSANFDDIYVCDGTGPAPFNDFLGQHHIVYKPVNGNGTVNNFTGSDADSVDNYLHVDEVQVIDEDTSYNGSSTSGHQDLYSCSIDVAEDTITALAVRTITKKTAAGAKAYQALVRSGGTTYKNSKVHWVSEEYALFEDIYTEDPDTAAAWDDDAVIEIGLEVV